MARIAVLLLLALTSLQALAGEPWSFVWVSRSTDWFVRQAHGQLERRGDTLRGTLQGDDGAVYRLSVKISGRRATGTFDVVPGDMGPTPLTGEYESVGAGQAGCWETIWLHGDYHHVGLAHNTACKP